MPGRTFPLRNFPLSKAAPRPIRAIFHARPNRFIANVVLPNGDGESAHLGDPGRLTGTLVPGCIVFLDGPYPPPRKCRYSLVAVQSGRTIVCTAPARANPLFAELWRQGVFPELPGKSITAEVTKGNSRFDFRIDNTFVEVKSVTLAIGKQGYFPDAVTARGAKHCRELAELAAQGTPAAIALIAQRADVASIAPADEIDPTFGKAIRDAAQAGVQILGCAVKFTANGATSAWRVPVRL